MIFTRRGIWLLLALFAFSIGVREAWVAEPPKGQEVAVNATEAAITLKPDAPVLVKKVQPLDCRLVRGFTHAPVDGRTDTRHARGGVGEWSGWGGVPAVTYRQFNESNGLHITLPDEGFDVLLARGGWRGKVYAGYQGLLPPAADVPVMCDMQPTGDAISQRVGAPAGTRRISFFFAERQGKPLADVTFLRVSPGETPAAGDTLTYGIAEAAAPDGLLRQAIAARFGPAARAYALREGGATTLALKKDEFIHLLTPAQDPAKGIGAVSLKFALGAVEPNTLFTVRVQDVLDPRREAMGVDFRVSGAGAYTLTLDLPDQAFLPPKEQWARPPKLDGTFVPPPVVWISLSAGGAAELGGASVTLHRVPRERALVEAGAWRKFLLRGLFSCMSEPRPWMNLTDKGPIREQVTGNADIKPYALSLMELLETAEMARLLLPEDDVVRQYHEWLYQNLDRRKPQPPPNLPQVPGAPAWAVSARETLRDLNAIATWWVENRLVPNGEFGGGINDDTDLFQTWQCLPMVESAPLGAALKDAAARLADLAWRETLEEGINKRTMDALHAYEEGVNQLALCAWWFYGDPVHYERCMIAARSALKLMVEMPDGRVHFGGDAVGIEQVRKGFEKLGATPGDGNWNPVRFFLHPVYVAAMYNRHPALLRRFEQWGETWARYQKPGEFVGKVDIATGKPLLVGKPTATSTAIGPVDEWLALYQITGDTKWLASFKLGLDSGGWLGTSPSYGRSPHALVPWEGPYREMMLKRFTGPAGGYAGFFLSKDRSNLDKWLNDSASWYGRFRYMDTAAEQKTDRVLTYQASAPVACYLGDAPNRNRYLNFTAVSYEGLRIDDFAALVWDAGTDRLRVAVHNFADRPLSGAMRVWRLDHGRYKIASGPDANDDGEVDAAQSERVAELQRYSAIPLALPPRQTTVIHVQQIERMDDILTRADLALSPIDTRLGADGAVEVQVHNIGAKAAQNVRVGLERGGRIVENVTLPAVEAPLDLEPKVVAARFRNARAGDVVVVDPENAIPEIAEHNNRLTLAAP